MSKKIQLIILPVILVSIMALFSFYGCGGGLATPGEGGFTTTPAAGSGEFSEQQLEQILATSVENNGTLDTYRFDMEMDMSADVKGGSESSKMSITSKSSGAMNLLLQQMQMKTDMTVTGEGLGMPGGEQKIGYDMYMMPDWTYFQMNYPDMTDQWQKSPTSDRLQQSFKMNDSIEQELGPLESPVKIEYLGSESVDGLDCYVLSITPDMQKVGEWLSNQQSSDGNINWQELASVANVFKKIDYVCYIVKTSNFLKKMVMNMEMEFTPEQAGGSAGDFDTMIMTTSVDMNLYDHNVNFSITVPAEAAGATEVSEDILFE